MDAKEIKKATGIKAVDTLVKDGMKLGMGTGSTALEAMRRLQERMQSGDIKTIFVVPTSLQTEFECRRFGIPLYSLNDPVINGRLDLTIDGADEVDPAWNLIKGGGGALLLEKIVGFASDAYAIIADESKLVGQLGETFAVPVEVLPDALTLVSKELEKLGGVPVLREAVRQAGPVITKNGNLILDTRFKAISKPKELEKVLNNIPGVMENGIFTLPVTDLFIGRKEGIVEHTAR